MYNKQYFVYIATNKSFTLYTGISNSLVRRTWEHKEKIIDGFTKRYNINKLIYYEVYDNPSEAIRREKEIKGWLRRKKIALIKTMNPKFRDLSEDWNKFNDNKK